MVLVRILNSVCFKNQLMLIKFKVFLGYWTIMNCQLCRVYTSLINTGELSSM